MSATRRSCPLTSGATAHTKACGLERRASLRVAARAREDDAPELHDLAVDAEEQEPRHREASNARERAEIATRAPTMKEEKGAGGDEHERARVPIAIEEQRGQRAGGGTAFYVFLPDGLR